EHLYDLRVILELAAVRKLCAAETGDALSGIAQQWLVPVHQRLLDWREVARIDEAFHATLVAAAGNPELARAHSEVTECIRIVRRLDFTQRGRVEWTYDDHGAIIGAVRLGKVQPATRLLEWHIVRSKV